MQQNFTVHIPLVMASSAFGQEDDAKILLIGVTFTILRSLC